MSGNAGGYRSPASTRFQEMLAVAQEEAAQIRAQARDELTSAREEARLLRDQVYAEALQARRDFEAALQARRRREARVDEILREVDLVAVSVEQGSGGPTGSAVPATRAAAGGPTERATPAG